MTATLSRAWNMTELAKVAGSRPRVHPNGFVQLDLDHDRRLHFWPDDPQRFVEAAPHPIHDHVFEMRSKVLRGCMIQTVHRLELEHHGEPTHEILVARYHTPTDSELRRSGVLVRLSELPEQHLRIEAGESYDQPAYTFHTSEPEGLTITVMHKRSELPGSCRVLLPLGAEPLARFDREAWSANELWAFIDECLEP